MNPLELKMLDLLKELKANFHVTGVKAEFEAEGTRIEEAMRLKDITAAAGLHLNIKIGGCEAIKDMLDAMNLGAKHVIAPMVETPYALQKFIRAASMVYDQSQIEFLINTETQTTFQNFPAMLKLPEIKYLRGIVIGRVDMAGSLGIARSEINGKKILDISLELAARAKEKGLRVGVGGGISMDSVPFFKKFPQDHLDYFETRKLIFDCPAAVHNPEEAFLKAIEFELLWLNNKKNYYGTIAHEDDQRIKLIENRYKKSKKLFVEA